MEAIQIGPGFAAEMRGVTLADVTNNDAVYAEVRAAFEKHSVLVFRNQKVSDESQLAFSRRFGPPELTKVGSLGTGTHFVILTTIDQDGKVVPPDHRYAMRNKANQLWHTDSSFKSTSALTSILSARIIPARGGSKGVPGKNIRLVAGRPLLAWTVEAARRATTIDRLILSSDDADIIRIAAECGCEAPAGGRA